MGVIPFGQILFIERIRHNFRLLNRRNGCYRYSRRWAAPMMAAQRASLVSR
jgi:hypothetical protein